MELSGQPFGFGDKSGLVDRPKPVSFVVRQPEFKAIVFAPSNGVPVAGVRIKRFAEFSDVSSGRLLG